MTKRDFVQIAEALLKAKPTAYPPASDPESREAHDREIVALAETVAWQNCCLEIANTLAAVNPRFDRARFLSACGSRLC